MLVLNYTYLLSDPFTIFYTESPIVIDATIYILEEGEDQYWYIIGLGRSQQTRFGMEPSSGSDFVVKPVPSTGTGRCHNTGDSDWCTGRKLATKTGTRN